MRGGGGGAATRGRHEWRRHTGRGGTERFQDQAAVGSGAARGLPGATEKRGCLQNRSRGHQVSPARVRNHSWSSGGGTQSPARLSGLRPKQTARNKSSGTEERPHARRRDSKQSSRTFSQGVHEA